MLLREWRKANPPTPTIWTIDGFGKVYYIILLEIAVIFGSTFFVGVPKNFIME